MQIFVSEGVNNLQCGIIRWSRHNHQLGLLRRTFRYAKMGMGSGMRQKIRSNWLAFLGDCRRLAFNLHFGWELILTKLFLKVGFWWTTNKAFNLVCEHAKFYNFFSCDDVQTSIHCSFVWGRKINLQMLLLP